MYHSICAHVCTVWIAVAELISGAKGVSAR